MNIDASSCLYPGTVLELYGTGVWLQGESGCGKSDLTLRLLDRGHVFIADDAVAISRQADDLIATVPEGGSGRLAVRGLGPVDIRRLFPHHLVKSSTRIGLIIQLQPGHTVNWTSEAMLLGAQQTIDREGIAVVQYVLPVAAQRPLAQLVELYTKHFLTMHGQQANSRVWV